MLPNSAKPRHMPLPAGSEPEQSTDKFEKKIRKRDTVTIQSNILDTGGRLSILSFKAELLVGSIILCPFVNIVCHET